MERTNMADSTFVKNAKVLEKLKSGDSIPDNIIQNGKYFFMGKKGEYVFLQEHCKVMWTNFKDVPNNATNPPLTVLLDTFTVENTCIFVVDIELPNDSARTEFETQYNGRFVNSRQSLFVLNKKESQYAAQGRGLINFCQTHKFCCFCGGDLLLKASGTQKKCIKCQQIHYPPLSPVGITLIENEEGTEVLLVRQSRHPKGMYSCVAGFIEPGESLEQNIRREIAEEVGLEVSCIRYITSQHWAMPASQLMLGCIATARSKNFDLDVNEIEAAEWVTSHQLEKAVSRSAKLQSFQGVSERELWVPPPSAVAHTLMSVWLQEKRGQQHLTSKSHM